MINFAYDLDNNLFNIFLYLEMLYRMDNINYINDTEDTRV